MLWISSERKTRSGAIFGAFMPPSAATLQCSSFDLEPLLRLSSARESFDGDESDDDHDYIDANGPDDVPYHPLDPAHLETPSLHPDLDEPGPEPHPALHPDLDEPPTKRRRVTIADRIARGEVPEKGPSNRKRHRKAQREAKKQTLGQIPRAATVHAQVHADAAISTGVDAHSLPVAHGAYTAKKGDETYGAKKKRTLGELIGMGFQLVQWDGYTPQPIVDCKGRIIVVLAGQPRDPTYAAAVKNVYATMCDQRTKPAFPSTMSAGNRGPFPAFNCGLTYGKGQKVPSRMLGVHAWLIRKLLGDHDVRRMATFASAAFGLWAPKLYAYYKEHDDLLRQHLPHLERNFSNSVFACAAFNFGPNVWTYKHQDILNVPFGMCVVQALGPFDATKGGHMILWELRLVIEFPSGAAILLPSATITHSNLPVQPGDERASFTQYTGGGLLRYVDNGFRTEKELEEQDTEEYARILDLKDTRWEMGLNLLSTVDELLEAVA